MRKMQIISQKFQEIQWRIGLRILKYLSFKICHQCCGLVEELKHMIITCMLETGGKFMKLVIDGFRILMEVSIENGMGIIWMW